MVTRLHRRKFLENTATLAGTAMGARGFAVPAILAQSVAQLQAQHRHRRGRGPGPRPNPHLNENLVALCDVVEGTVSSCLGQAETYYKDHGLNKPLPKKFSDYREMLDKMHGQIDAVFVGTPDHRHAPGLDDGD